MKKKLGLELDEKDYDMNYDGYDDSQSDTDEIAHKNPSRKFGSYTPSTDASDHDEILGGAPEYTVDTDGVESNE